MLTYGHILLRARLDRMDERGASAVEYGLLLAGVASVIVLVVFAFGGNVRDLFQETDDAIEGNLSR